MGDLNTNIQRIYEWVETQKKSNAKKLPVIFLEGPLGAGKTTFTKSLLSRYGVDENEVQSPTFLKVLEYKNNDEEIFLHLDCYRVDEPDDIEHFGLEHYSDSSKLTLMIVEWAQKFDDYLKTHSQVKLLLGIGKILRLEISSDHKIIQWSEK